MRLRTGVTCWQAGATSDGLRGRVLDRDLRCDVAVVGAGISGALVADRLAAAGLSVIVVDRRPVAGGSTAASTALLLPEGDVQLVELSRRLGPSRAARAYALAHASVRGLGRLAAELRLGGAFRRKRSLYVGFRPGDGETLEAEHALRRRYGLPGRLLGRRQLRARFGLEAQGALLSSAAAEVDPVRLTRALLRRAVARGARLYDRVEIQRISESSRGCELETARHGIRARRLVVATGYEGRAAAGRGRVRLSSSYVIASEPVPGLRSHWLWDHLLWETRRPYLYARTTADGRLVIGGEDEPVVDEPTRDAKLPAKTRRLEERIRALVPDLRIRTAFAWTGTFGETPDGLGYVGVPAGWRDALFLLGYGGNGITFAWTGAGIVASLLLDGRARDAGLFAFGR